MGFYNRKLKDYDGENSSVTVHAADLNAGNIATELTLQSNFGAALNNITLGSLQTIRYGNGVDALSAAPSDVWAQRELKWFVQFRDTVNGEPGHFTVPTADATKLDPNNRGHAYIGDAGDVDAFITAAEAYVKSRDGNAIEILDITLIGVGI